MATSSNQPPSGGCVLKQGVIDTGRAAEDPAAFGRLCVETFRRALWLKNSWPAAFGRLCVETLTFWLVTHCLKTSRLRAAVC